jgi:hypothetical protein
MDTTTAQVTADLQTIFLGEKDIQDDQVVGRQFCKVLSLLPIIGGIDGYILRVSDLRPVS